MTEKTLAEIARAAWMAAGNSEDHWEITAAAVRKAVIEECAKKIHDVRSAQVMRRDPLALPERQIIGKRKAITKDEKLASALLEITALRGDPIPLEHAKLMSAAQICSLFEWDHARRHIQGGTNHPTNLTPRFPGDHQEKTSKFDIPQIRKADRLAASHDAGIMRQRAKVFGEPTPKEERKSRWQSRPMQSRNTLADRKTAEPNGKRVKPKFSRWRRSALPLTPSPSE
jgi:hypothetical protein